ncbi:20945_t:CDS:1, partial [Cetraspora pellucida]
LQEFAYKNLKTNIKFHQDETLLQMVEWGLISVRKRNTYSKFSDISEWLLAFRSYMEAILIMYKDREHELNFYHDHISTLCTKYEFTAVMVYEEDQRLALTMDRESTLFDRNIEAEGENFDITTTKKFKISKPRIHKTELIWHDGREICINWNRRYCSEDKKCSHVHACLTCKKIGHTERKCFVGNTESNSAARGNSQADSQPKI